MAWFWFLILVIVLFFEVRAGVKNQAVVRKYEAIIASLITLSMDSGEKPEKLILQYIEYLEHSLTYQDYDEFMSQLCAINGMTYATDDGTRGGLLAQELRPELARRMAQGWITVQERLNDRVADTYLDD